jgi:hypothetical protein
MDLSISPDVEAYYCYLLVLLIGLAVARKHVAGLLEGFRGVWVMRDTWLLLGVYASVPVVLFWLLDRTGALHDTSVLGAVLVGIGYRQIITGGVQGMAAPSQVSQAWQPLLDWTKRVAARIRDRILTYNARYEERVISRLSGDPQKMQGMIKLVQGYVADPGAVESELQSLATNFAALGEAGVSRRQAAWLYRSLQKLPNVDCEYLMLQQGITSRGMYF